MLQQAGTFVGLLALVALAGCNSEDRGESVKVYPVKGRVTLPSGEPLAEGSVVFVPAPKSETARQAAGKLKSDGSFVLSTPNSGDGAAPGDYKVRIETADIGPALKPGPRQKTPPKFDIGYLDEDSSNLRFTVAAGDNSFDIKLSPIPKAR
jgi:hypothetical protein